MQASAEKIWGAAQEHLRSMLSADTYNLWFAPLRANSLDHNSLALEVANDFCEVWLKDNYLGLLQDVLALASGRHLQVKFKVGATPGAPVVPHPPEPEAKAAKAPNERNAANHDIGFNPKNTFETFVVGNNNNFACAAAQAVAQAPGKSYNPLFLYGGVGLGKTHLLHAIGQHVVAHKKGARVAYLSSERFTNEYIDGIQNNQLARFRKQIVLTCDRPASEIQNLEQRLVSRFEWGLVTDLQPPDVEMRLAILQKKAQIMGANLPEDIMNFLANRIRTNIRRLEGALIRVASYASLTGKKLSVEVVEGLLREILNEEGRYSVNIEVIQKKVAEHFDIRLADMTSKRRPESIAFPRQVAMFLARQMTETSLSAIGEAFGGRDHGTVLHACRLVKDRMEVDPNVRQVVSYLEKALMR
jgi:chromosomal replication initiator protein